MEATRARLRVGPAVEWLVAAAFLLATLGVASLIVRELRTVPASTAPTAPAAPVTLMPAAVPARAVSVPVLLLLDGRQVRVGDSVDHVASSLGRSAEVGTQVVDRGALGDRLTRFYDHQGTRFLLVFEPFERNGGLRVAAIYLH